MDVKRVSNIEDFDQALAEYAQKKEQERRLAVAKHAAEQASIKASQQAAIDARRAEQKAVEERFELLRLEAVKAEAVRKKEENDKRVKLELEQNALEEKLRQERIEATKRTQDLEHKAYLEEQYRKSLVVLREEVVRPQEEDEDFVGNAVKGTEGHTPDTPLMSNHMRRILRQTNRQD